MAADKPRRRKPKDDGWRGIVTPEGVVVPVELAPLGERAAALAIDLAILLGGLIAFVVLLAFAVGRAGGDHRWLTAAALLASFLVRSFYFAFFEARWNGATPGKKALGLRAVDRHGRPLTGTAVLARNLMREVELFLPLSVLWTPRTFSAADSIPLLALVWLGVLVLLPVFNRDRLRAGDMVAGTWVIALPKRQLAPDLVKEEALAPADGGFLFTVKQLDIYGVLELQTLEEVLRQQGVAAEETRREVARRIARKIGWETPDAAAREAPAFLAAFYAQLRARLEHGLAFGIRRADQHDRNSKG